MVAGLFWSCLASVWSSTIENDGTWPTRIAVSDGLVQSGGSGRRILMVMAIFIPFGPENGRTRGAVTLEFLGLF